MAYNMTGVDEATNFYEILKGVNALTPTEGLFFGVILISLWFVLLLAFQAYGFAKSLFASSLIISMASIFFLFLGLIGWTIAVFPMLVCLVSILLLFFTEQ